MVPMYLERSEESSYMSIRSFLLSTEKSQMDYLDVAKGFFDIGKASFLVFLFSFLTTVLFLLAFSLKELH